MGLTTVFGSRELGDDQSPLVYQLQHIHRHKENRACLEAPGRRGLLRVRLCLAMSQRCVRKVSAEAIAI